ncbi:MAG: hypothetical protein JWN28_592 [Candidatus Saccharibacteria bacterium]|nr:hypothetical protein [Candidatus Saccharibacteria bacterium]
MAVQESETEVPLYATQGGGIAAYKNGKFVWHSEIPGFMIAEGAKVGDVIPDEWGVVGINPAAHREMEQDQTDSSDDYWDYNPMP